MALYAVCYDLHHEPPSVYDDLKAALGSLDSFHAQESCWLVASGLSSRELDGHLRPHIHRGDELFILQIATSGYWVTPNTPLYKWLVHHERLASGKSG